MWTAAVVCLRHPSSVASTSSVMPQLRHEGLHLHIRPFQYMIKHSQAYSIRSFYTRSFSIARAHRKLQKRTELHGDLPTCPFSETSTVALRRDSRTDTTHRAPIRLLDSISTRHTGHQIRLLVQAEGKARHTRATVAVLKQRDARSAVPNRTIRIRVRFFIIVV